MRKAFHFLGVTLGVALPLVVAAGIATPSAGAYSLPRCQPVIDQTFPPPTFPCPDPDDPTVLPLTVFGQQPGSTHDAQP